MPLTAGTRIGSYEIETPIGAGAMGEVYRARDTRLDRDVALKILPESFASDPERLMRFEREAKALATLNKHRRHCRAGRPARTPATLADFGAESARPALLCAYASPRQSPGAGATLTTGLPATALTGLDLHQLDSFQRFHVLMNVPPLLRFVAR
jgi:serine/threonine protein kinase